MKTLTWKVKYNQPAPCPDHRPDPYTGQYPTTHCLVYHFETVTEQRTADFATEQEALDFAAKAPLSCDEFKLNGKSIEDKRPKPQITTIGNGITGTDGGFLTINGTATGTTITTL